jgi:hypothetical protein
MLDHVKRWGWPARCVAVAALALGAAPASAAACADPPTTVAFAQWGDTSDYFAAPGGTFEGGTGGWTGGSMLSINEPWRVAGAGDSQSLRVAENQTVASPVFCASALHPDFRFFARPLTRWSSGALDAYVRYVDPLGITQTVPVGTIDGARDWVVAPKLRLTRDLPLPDSGELAMQILFTARDGAWAIDDVFVDPYRK